MPRRSRRRRSTTPPPPPPLVAPPELSLTEAHRSLLALADSFSTLTLLPGGSSANLLGDSARILHREHAPLDLIEIDYPPPRIKINKSVPPPPTRQPRAPSSISDNLQISFGEQLSSGRYGAIFEALVVDSEDRHRLQPLVAKVALNHCRGNMAREAWTYEELWPLQGVAIPLCFGWFEVDVPPRDKFRRRLNAASTRPLRPVDPGSSFGDNAFPYKASRIEEEDDSPPIRGRLAEIHAVATKLSILLIERLGQHYLPLPDCNESCIPSHHQHWASPKKPEVAHAMLMGREFAPYSVDLPHLAARHILHAPHTPASQLAKALSKSPNSALLEGSLGYPPNPTQSGDILEWRVVDLESGRKLLARVEGEFAEAVRYLYDWLPEDVSVGRMAFEWF